MALTEHCYSVLLVSASDKLTASLRAMLPCDRYDPVVVAGDVASARRCLLEKSFDLILINTPLPDEFGTHLAMDVCNSSGTGVLLLVRAEHFPDISARVSPYGILVLSKPTNGTILTQSLTLCCATRDRLRRMAEKAATMEEKMEEIRLVNRAKWILIDQLKMTEKEAHRFIEKQAMDRCITRRAVAENIVSTYS